MLLKISEANSTVPYPRIFWQSAFSPTYRLAWGHKALASTLPMSLLSSWFGCLGFEKGQGWFFQPQKKVDEAVERFNLKSTCPLPPILHRSDSPSFPEWESNVNTALEQIGKGLLQKVVLARSTVILLEKPVSPWDMLAKLKEHHHPSTTLFLVQRSPVTAFIGATPEKLYQRKGKEIRTMALAGTCQRGSGPDEDYFLRQELLASEKEQHEVAIVHRELMASLETLCQSMKSDDKPSILETRNLFHLLYSLQGELRPDIADRQLLQLLHPTPALGGAPRAKALRLIKTLEPFRRGWYGAPLGWFSEDEADVAVGIRSAMIQNNKVHLFAGAGIVTGSDPAKEWEELDNKIGGFLKLWETT